MKDPANALAEVAPTLELLRKLPMDQKCRLLLARLEKLGRHNSGALNKQNLMLAGDPYGLASGYPDAEKTPVREHLLGAPWNKLVNDGYLVDLSGHGFHKVSVEGLEYLEQGDVPHPFGLPVKAPAILPARIPGVPRAFISYSWDGDEHEEWVLQFAKRQQGESGVQIILDRWHLKPGQDKLHFMEQAVATSDFVVIVCTEKYAQRANDREGGVGYESGAITSQMAEDMATNKFIPVLRQGSFKTSLPIYIKGRLGVNLSDKPYREDEYERLIRVLHGEPLQPPPIGKKPDFTKKTAKAAIRSVVDASVKTTGTGTEAVPPMERPTQRPNGIVYARYDKPGQAGAWITAIVRLWEIKGEQSYSFETIKGDKMTGEEFISTKDEVISRFFDFHRAMLKDGYKRMNFTPGPDPEFNVLQ